MEEKRAMDGSGAAVLVGFAMLLAVNQIVIKVTGGGFGPVFQAGLRSGLGLIVLLIWMRFRGLQIIPSSSLIYWSGISGLVFSLEFICLYLALDLSSVSRVSIIFYSMPVWLALAGHFLLPAERLNGVRVVGLVLAMGGVVLALADPSTRQASLWGDLLALAAAMFWAGIALVIRMSPLSRVIPEIQMLGMIAVSTLILLGLAPLLGDLQRDPTPLHWLGLAFQSVFVVSLGYLVWARLISIYRAGAVASFSFLSPVFAVILAWWILDEHVSPLIWVALALVAVGLVLINRR